MGKDSIRQVVREKRRLLDASFVEEASLKVQKLFFSLEELNVADRLGLYAASENEVNTRDIFNRLYMDRKRLFFPLVSEQSKALHFSRVHKWEDLIVGFKGILEPADKNRILKDINDLQLIILPGVAFDIRGNRLGRGSGYYDRLLKGYRGTRIGLAYEFQILDSLPANADDQCVDCIVTEERIIRFH